MTDERLLEAMGEAEDKAIDSLCRYKFQMFGYWAAIWVHLNHLGGFRRPNPFRSLVAAARIQQVGYDKEPVVVAGPPPPFICASCGPVELDVHLRCGKCGSDSVTPNHAPVVSQ